MREDALQLFGFASPRERAFFLALIAVSGVGPKVALAILSGYPVDELEAAVARGDAKKFESIPGIGKKLAQRLVIELKDKVGAALAGRVAGGRGAATPPADVVLQARSALQNLGLTPARGRRGAQGRPGRRRPRRTCSSTPSARRGAG